MAAKDGSARSRDGARSGVAAGDGGDDEVRRRALAQLLHQETLRGARVPWKERRKVRGVAGVEDDDGGENRAECPDQGARNAGTPHGGSSGPTVSVELSPSLWWISTVPIRSRSPAMRTRCTLRLSVASAGMSSRDQRSRLPEKCTVK